MQKIAMSGCGSFQAKSQRAIKILFGLSLGLATLLWVQPASASSIPTCTTPATGVTSCTGTLATSEDYASVSVVVGANGSTLDIQTWSFGGGTNAAGNAIAPGSFVPIVAVYSGATLANAPIVPVDFVFGGTTGKQLLSETYDPTTTTPSSAVAGDSLVDAVTGNPLTGLCGPGEPGATGFGGECGDATLILTNLAAGTYQVYLSDAFYQPASVNPGLPAVSMFDGVSFTDFTGGSFTNCDPRATTCGQYAVDVSLKSPTVSTPEPGTFVLFGTGLLSMAGLPGLLKRRSGRV